MCGRDIHTINTQINTRTSKVLPTINKPLENGNDNDNRKRRNAIIYRICQLPTSIMIGSHLLMLLPVTLRDGGKTNKTVVRAM